MKNIFKICLLILFVIPFACNKDHSTSGDSGENKKTEITLPDSISVSKERQFTSAEDTTKKRKFIEAYYISRLGDSVDVTEFVPVVEKTSKAFAGVYSTIPSPSAKGEKNSDIWEQLVLEFKDPEGPVCTITTYKGDKKISEDTLKDVKVIKDIFTAMRGNRVVRGRFVKVMKKKFVIYGLLLGDGPKNKFFELEE
ncbi:MAG: hypothetical protein ACP5P3_05390 [Ignavibacteria bacterium]